jgi:LacI family transcriptional regulator
VIGFDDIITSRLVTPPLTTVSSPTRQMGAMGVKNVVAMIKGAQHKAVEALVIPVQLRVRGSTGPRRSSRAGVR